MQKHLTRPDINANDATYMIELGSTTEQFFGLVTRVQLYVIIVHENSDDMWDFERQALYKKASKVAKWYMKTHLKRNVKFQLIMRLPEANEKQPSYGQRIKIPKSIINSIGD